MVWTEVFVSTHLHRQHNPCVNTILARKDLGHRAQSTAHIWVDSLCYQQACHGCSNIMKGGYPWYLQCKTPTTKMVLLLPFAFDSLQIGSKSGCISDFWFGNMVPVWGGQVPTSDTDYLATNWIVSNRTKSGWNFKISFMGRVKPKPKSGFRFLRAQGVWSDGIVTEMDVFTVSCLLRSLPRHLDRTDINPPVLRNVEHWS